MNEMSKIKRNPAAVKIAEYNGWASPSNTVK